MATTDGLNFMPSHAKMILVTGAGGSLGAALLGQLRASGWIIRALVLPDSPFCANADETVEADLCVASGLGKCLADVDVVLHMAGLILSNEPDRFFAVNTEGTRNLVQACVQMGVRRFVYVSSISVEYPVRNPYAESKRLAEDIVRSHGLDWTIVRPTLLVGRGGGAEYRMFARLARYPFLLLPQGGTALKRPIHVDDLSSGLCKLLGSSASLGKTYNLAGCDILSLRQMISAIRQDESRKRLSVGSVPVLFCKVLARILDWVPLRRYSARQALFGLVTDCVPSIEDAQSDFAFSPCSLTGRWRK